MAHVFRIFGSLELGCEYSGVRIYGGWGSAHRVLRVLGVVVGKDMGFGLSVHNLRPGALKRAAVRRNSYDRLMAMMIKITQHHGSVNDIAKNVIHFLKDDNTTGIWRGFVASCV